MKIVVFGGGLGNQIFEYGFYKHLKLNFKSEKVYGIYHGRWLNEHNGLEIDRIFQVKLPKQSFIALIVASGLFLLKKIGLYSKLIDMGTRTVNPNAIVYNGCKVNKAFIPKGTDWLKFKIFELNPQNDFVLNRINECNSVFVHIRRGDYLSDKYRKRFEGTCPITYYHSAISFMEKNFEKPFYFVFSDDIEWVKKNIQLPSNATYITWNTGKDSYIDMYLMSNCKAGIIANSTFSFWAARLGKEKKIVTYPERWINTEDGAPDIFPDSWIKL